MRFAEYKWAGPSRLTNLMGSHKPQGGKKNAWLARWSPLGHQFCTSVLADKIGVRKTERWRQQVLRPRIWLTIDVQYEVKNANRCKGGFIQRGQLHQITKQTSVKIKVKKDKNVAIQI